MTNTESLAGRRGWLRIGIAVLAGGLLLALLVWLLWPQPAWIQGQIEVTQLRAAAKLPGRVASIEVIEGQRVEAGQLVARLSAPELEARAAQADALVAAATAQADKAQRGARGEEVRAARAQWQAAEAQAELAEVTARRMQALHADGVVPAQKRDEARAMATGARAQAQAARELWQMAQRGARGEDVRAAEAALAQAEGGRAELRIAEAEEQVLAPAAGEVLRRIFEPGEVVPAGAPLLLIARSDDPWLVLNLREDLLAGIEIGTELVGRVPALADRQLRFVVDYIAPMADFATWRSTRDLGGFDLRSFEVRARPTEPVPALRAGMSVLIAESALSPRGR